MSRVKVAYRSTEKKVYDRFCKENPDVIIPFREWEKIIYCYNHNFRDYILETGEKAKIPCGLGALAIHAKKTKKYVTHNGVEHVNLHVDWKRSKELGKKVYHMNSHTDGKSFKWMWFMNDATFYQANIWSFKPCRVASRKIKEHVEKDTQKCLEIYKQWK